MGCLEGLRGHPRSISQPVSSEELEQAMHVHLGLPQIIFVGLTVVGSFIEVRRGGDPNAVFVGAAFNLAILYWGGFFS